VSEQHQSYRDAFDFAEIWRSAQHSRAADVGTWLRHFFERRPEIKLVDLIEPQYHQGKRVA
jgi:hypothetical protein